MSSPALRRPLATFLLKKKRKRNASSDVSDGEMSAHVPSSAEDDDEFAQVTRTRHSNVLRPSLGLELNRVLFANKRMTIGQSQENVYIEGARL